jgi:ABC-type uncharacterized transport system substrate-binding protein
VAEPVRAAAAPRAGRVALLTSHDQPLAEAALGGFLAASDAEVQVFKRVARATPRRVVRAVRAYAPDLVVTVGTDATLLARERLSDLPRLFMLVMNQAQHRLAADPNLMGVALELAPLVEFAQFKRVLPALRRVVAFYDPDASAAEIQQARSELRRLGITLDAVPWGPDMPGAASAALQAADAVWILNDSVVLPHARRILRAAAAQGRPVVTSFSGALARQGALMSVSVSAEGTGIQAARMAHDYLTGRRTPAQLGVQYPVGAHLVVNDEVLRRYDIRLSREVEALVGRFVKTDPVASTVAPP